MLGLLLGLSTAALLAAAWFQRPSLVGIVNLLPETAPAVRLDTEITAEFGMQNPVVWVIAARRGTIWTRPLLAHIQALTNEVFTLPGVVATDVLSIASPNLRDVEVTDESLQPTYIMAEVPRSDEELAALRRRVEGNRNFNGVFVSRDGRAAMIVADFAPDVDPRAAGTAALALRDRHRDADTQVYVSGRPVVAVSIWFPAARVAVVAMLVLAVGAVVLGLACGARFLLAAVLAITLTVAWAVSALVLLNAIVLPWTVFAVLPAVLLAVVFVASPPEAWRDLPAVASGVLLGCVAMALITSPPARALGGAMAASVLAAVLAAAAVQSLVGAAPRAFARGRAPSVAALALIVIATPGLLRLHSSFAFPDYARRYLPPGAASDLRAIAEHFPPPVALAFRLRGEPGFVQSPAVLRAIEGVTAAAREDAAVSRALSLADLVKLMHRAFNDNRPEFFAIPDDPALVARYLTLGYSPGFRAFVDRAFSRTAVWVYLDSGDPRDVDRVRAKMAAQLALRPPPEGTVDFAGGDGALILVAASMVRNLAYGSAIGLLVAGLIIGIAARPSVGIHALLGGGLTAATAGGAMGWMGVPIDILSFPLLVAAGAVGCVLRASTGAGSFASFAGISLTLAVMAVPALLIAYPAAHLIGSTFLAIATAAVPWTVRGEPVPTHVANSEALPANSSEL